MNEVKLHLGSGEKYLEGYTNIDYPPSEHTVIKVKADIYQDIRTLAYAENSVDEIRSHHVFEHFPRTDALKLLDQWRRWLKPGGMLVIETPDFDACAKRYAWALSERRRLQLGRHMFGSQEAKWAYHYDFWDRRKYKLVLGEMGFNNIRVTRFSNGVAQHLYPKYPYLRLLLNFLGDCLPEGFYAKHGGHKLPNIVARAQKTSAPNPVLKDAARTILSMYLVGREGEEMLGAWLKEFESNR